MDLRDVIRDVHSSLGLARKAGVTTTEFGLTAPLIAYFVFQDWQSGDWRYGALGAAILMVYIIGRALVKKGVG